MEPQRLPTPGERLRPPSSGVLPSRQQYHIGDYPGTPPPSVYQVTQGTALQAAECNVMLHVLVLPSRQRSAMCSNCAVGIGSSKV